jgi:hypothetical protein
MKRFCLDEDELNDDEKYAECAGNDCSIDKDIEEIRSSILREKAIYKENFKKTGQIETGKA